MPREGSHALIFNARVGDKSVQGLDLLRTDDSGRITNLTVMIRPLSGLIALAEAMAPEGRPPGASSTRGRVGP